MTEKKIYFKGLNALRFFAATAVIFHHIEQYKFWKGYDSIWGADGWIGIAIDALGHKAVSFFFALSGFLITYLLLAEIKKTSTVALKKFYLRRVLRIWPLYYLVAAFALFVLPSISEFDKWEPMMQASMGLVTFLYLIILPNLLRVTSIQVVGANQAWSVGVEEQFYLIWPLLIKWFHKKMPQFLIAFIVLKLGLEGTCTLIGNSTDGSMAKYFGQLGTLLTHMQIEQMAVGGLGAWWLFEGKSIIKTLYQPAIHYGAWLLFMSFFFVEYHFYGHTVFEGLVFLIIILNVSTNARFPLNLENPFLTWMGNISYGIYMLHAIVIALLITWLEERNLSSWSFNLCLYLLAPLFTFLLASISYKYFETFFLRFKEKFAVVKSNTHRKP